MAKETKEVGLDLCFKRAIDCGKAFFFSVDEDNLRVPLLDEKVAALGCRSSYSEYQNTSKYGRSNFGESNPAAGENSHVFLPENSNTLLIKYGISFHAPKPLNYNKEGLENIKDFFIKSRDINGFGIELYRELATRYLWNILNGRVFFRNLDLAGQVKTRIIYANRKNDDGTLKTIDYIFNGGAKKIQFFDPSYINDRVDIKNLIEDITYALMDSDVNGHMPFVNLNIESSIELYNGAEIFPSQNFAGNDDKKEGRVFYLANDAIGQVGLHSQKVGNAIRTIDSWYNNDDSEVSPVEFLGYNKSKRDALRYDEGNIYQMIKTHIKTWTEKDKPLNIENEIDKNRMLYTLAVFCRGGILTTSVKDKATKKSDSSQENESEE